MMTIKTKSFSYGDEKEADWPPQYPENPRGLVGYWDSESQTFKEGYPPNPNNNFGTAPTVIFDAMPKTYHEGAGRDVESRKEWERLDKETGCITFGSIEESRHTIAQKQQEEAKALKQDRRSAALEAIRKVRANPEEIRQKFNKKAEAQKASLEKLAKKKHNKALLGLAERI